MGIEDLKLSKQTLIDKDFKLPIGWILVNNEAVKDIWKEVESQNDYKPGYLKHMIDVAEALVNTAYNVTFIMCDVKTNDDFPIQNIIVATMPLETFGTIKKNIGTMAIHLLGNVINLDHFQVSISKKMVTDKGIVFIISTIKNNANPLQHFQYQQSTMSH